MNEKRPAAQPAAPTAPASSAPATNDASIGLSESKAGTTATKINVFGSDAPKAAPSKFTRAPNVTGYGACRVKSFIGKISTPGLEFLDNNINQWIDAHPEVEVKFVTSTVGGMDGKHESAIVMNLWY